MEKKIKKTQIEKSELESSQFAVRKTRIEKRMRHKMDADLVATIIKLKKENPIVAKELSRPRRRWPAINLKEVDMIEGDILVAGKILSAGDLSSSKKIVAWSASNRALEKIKEAKADFVFIVDEMKKNPKLNGLSVVR